MAVVQKFKAAGLTFGKWDDMLHSIINACKDAARIDIVFDVYKQVSVKNAKRVRRCKNKLIFKDIILTCEIKQWNDFLSSSENEKSLTNFLCEHWKKRIFLEQLGGVEIFITCEDICYKLCDDTDWIIVDDLTTDQEEVDTRLLFHAKHARDAGYGDVSADN